MFQEIFLLQTQFLKINYSQNLSFLQGDPFTQKIDEFIDQNPKQKDEIKKFYRKSENKNKLYEDLLNEKLFTHINEFATNKISEKSTSELKKDKK